MDSQALIEMHFLVDGACGDRGLDFVPLKRPFGAYHPAEQLLSNSALLDIGNCGDASNYTLIARKSQQWDQMADDSSQKKVRQSVPAGSYESSMNSIAGMGHGIAHACSNPSGNPFGPISRLNSASDGCTYRFVTTSFA